MLRFRLPASLDFRYRPTSPSLVALNGRTTPALSSFILYPGFTPRGSRSRRVPREPLDPLENLPKEAPRQVAFGELQGEVPGMPDQGAFAGS
jgi:hypothetical protein